MNLFERARDVIESCQTLDQIEVADRYCARIINGWLRPKGQINLFKVNDAKEICSILRRQKEDLRIRSLVRDELGTLLF